VCVGEGRGEAHGAAVLGPVSGDVEVPGRTDDDDTVRFALRHVGREQLQSELVPRTYPADVDGTAGEQHLVRPVGVREASATENDAPREPRRNLRYRVR
jgi:hypothetical protein